MNLHLVQDTPFYTNHLIERIERLDCGKQWYIYLNVDKDLEYITSNLIHRISLDINIPKFLEERKISKIFVHSLTNSAMDFITKVPEEIKIYWFFWGWDGYRHPKLSNNIYLPKTRTYLIHSNSFGLLRKSWLKYRKYQFEKRMNSILKRIDFCCTQVIGDFHLIKSLSPKFKMEHIFFAYKGISPYTPQTCSDHTQSLTLLLGNSADPSNNHLDILYKLKPYTDKINQIICPLSYAGTEDYKKIVIESGYKLFGKKFIPLVKFMPLNEYIEIIETVDIGVFFHVRQQAYSNIISLIENDKRVLMNSESTLYRMFLDFKVGNVFADIESLFHRKEILNNQILNAKLGDKQIDKYYKKVFSQQIS